MIRNKKKIDVFHHLTFLYLVFKTTIAIVNERNPNWLCFDCEDAGCLLTMIHPQNCAMITKQPGS